MPKSNECFYVIYSKYIHYSSIVTGKLGPAYCRNAGTGGGGYLCGGGPAVPVPWAVANLCAIVASNDPPRLLTSQTLTSVITLLLPINTD
jgi:hypothetical protein